MFKNYFKIAWRNIKSNKFYSLINVSGLAIGLATGIMLLMWVQNELSYNKFYKDYQDIYKLSAHFEANGKEVTWGGVPGPLAVYADRMPQVVSLVRINGGNEVLANADQHKVLSGFHTVTADSNFFSMFDIKLLKGNRTEPFPSASSVVITRSTAEKLFGQNDPVGKVIGYNKSNFTVTGVIKDFPSNSTLQFDAIFPMAFYAQQFKARGGNGSWKTIDEDVGNYSFDTYVKLQPGANPENIGKAFTSAYKEARNGNSNTRFQLQNLESLHLVGADGNDSALKMVHIFMLVAGLLLLIAGINYVNLSTARSLVRAKEVGIRKVVGADRKQLFLQFCTETFLLFCMATLLAFMLIDLLMPVYDHITGNVQHFSLANPRVWKTIGYAVGGTLVAASIYPAVVLSSFNPVRSLKGKASSGTGTDFFRKTLVVFQFAISVLLIIGTFVIGRQLRYMRNKNLGYEKHHVFFVPLSEEAVNHIDAVKNELKSRSSIRNAALSNISDITDFGYSTGDIDWNGKPEDSNMIITQAAVDRDFIPTMKIHFLEGKNFSGTPADSTHYILNETAVKKMGLAPPYVGQQISFHGREGSIIGVVEDFNFKSLKEGVSPFIFYSWHWKGNMLYVRTTAGDAQEAIAAAQNQYKKYADSQPFIYHFVDARFDVLYKSDRRMASLFNVFAGIAIFISCLGLLGLTTFTAQRRVKEIGVRKVLGASVTGIVALLSKDFLKLVGIGFLIAVPVAWYVMHRWLQDYAYHTDMGIGLFAVAGFLAMLVALATISWQSVRAAVANPVDSLKSE